MEPRILVPRERRDSAAISRPFCPNGGSNEPLFVFALAKALAAEYTDTERLSLSICNFAIRLDTTRPQGYSPPNGPCLEVGVMRSSWELGLRISLFPGVLSPWTFLQSRPLRFLVRGNFLINCKEA